MKKKLVGLVVAIALAGSMASAENLFEKLFGAFLPDKVEVEKFPPPGESVASLQVRDALLKLVDYAGEVVRVDFDNVNAMRQVQSGYVAVISFRGRTLWDGMVVFVPNEGLSFFEAQIQREHRVTQTVFVQISKDGLPNRALGRRFRRSNAPGEQYVW